MFFADRSSNVPGIHRAAVVAALAGLLMAGAHILAAQQSFPAADELAKVPLPEPGSIALPIAEDRGAAALEQSLKRLSTTASILMIVAHPDDEDGALLTYLSRGLGVRATLLTLNRGEGGQNAMSADSYDALGLIRTNELLKADEYYGAKQLWGTEIDFGFSKTQEEAFSKWGHERVLYDAVLAVRRERPQIIVSTFVGGITDGHGHHQVSGEIAQEAFKAAADPKIFPEQLQPGSDGKPGLEPWQAQAVYSAVPFARVTDGKMFDYATGKWAPAKFLNYVTGEWSTDIPSADVAVPVGTFDLALGRSYVQIARQGWGEQKSQNGGASPTLTGPANSNYHLWAVAAAARAGASSATAPTNTDLFHNSKVSIDTTLGGLARLVNGNPPAWLTQGLYQIDVSLKVFATQSQGQSNIAMAHKLAPIYRQALDLYTKVAASSLDSESKAGLLFELDLKIQQFQSALGDLLGMDLVAFTTRESTLSGGGQGRGGSSAEEMPASVTPGQDLLVHVHSARAYSDALPFASAWFESETGETWKPATEVASQVTGETSDAIFRLHVPENAEFTRPYFTRPNTEQPYYDLTHPEYRERSFAPWPLAVWTEFTFDGLPIRTGQVVQTLHRVLGPGGIYEPLVITPAIGLRLDPQARILPLDGSALPVRVTVHAESAADGTLNLQLPAGWRSEPAEAHFHLDAAGDSEPIQFSVTPAAAQQGAYDLQAVAHSAGKTYQSGWQSIGYAGLRPYNLYQPAQLKTRKVDVKIAPSLRVGYVMGTGDLVPDAIEALGVTPHMLSTAEIASSDFSAWNVLVIGIRAYSNTPELAAAEPRLQEFVRRGGTLIVQYQSANFPAPLPLSMGRTPERVVDEQAPVKLLEPANPLLTYPNAITAADFDGWLEERGHSFLDKWDPGYTALTETADPGQDPQRGGLLVTHPGKGTYIYIAYALYRQLPELVPGSYRLLANLLSAGGSAK
jgi:LmbE family N-acetylglucosaminyl deacetylase